MSKSTWIGDAGLAIIFQGVVWWASTNSFVCHEVTRVAATSIAILTLICQ